VATECFWNDGSKTQYYVVILDRLQGHSGGLEWAPEWRIRGPLTTTPKQKLNSYLICANPNCKQRGHTIDVCYWPGGEKEGQFPSGFGKRGGARGTAINTKQGSSCYIPTVNVAEAKEEDKQAFAFMTMKDSDIKVQPPLPSRTVISSDSHNTSSYDKITNQGRSSKGMQVDSNQASGDPVILYTKTQNRLTLIDSGTSDHCFADKSMFLSYTPFERPSEGLSAGKGSVFSIVGKGNVKFQTHINGKTRNIIFKDVLHTPGLRSNLILVPKLERKGTGVIFRNGKATVELANSSKVLSAVKFGRIYIVELDGMSPETSLAQSKHKPASFDTWHHCLAHTRADVLRKMISKQLVDGLHMYGDLTMKE